MLDEIQNVTMRLGRMALDAYEQRQLVLANNVANASVDGFQAQRLNFESQLQDVRAAVASGADDKTLLALMDRVRPHVEARPADTVIGDPHQRLDEEMTLMVQNTMQYESVLTALARESALMRVAVTGEP